jgi:hypothetical protein
VSVIGYIYISLFLDKRREERFHTVAMSQEMTLELRLLRKWFIWAVAAFPAAIITVSLFPTYGICMLREEMLLEFPRC